MAELGVHKMSVLKSLFPAAVVVIEAIGVQNWISDLTLEEEAFAKRCVPKRRQEFAAGRNCARRALQELGFAPQSIGVGSRREPLFPKGTSGTITHTGDYCAAAVVRCGEIESIGIDAETNGPLQASILPLILHPDEKNMLSEASQLVRFPDTLVFSIKEAFFKAYFQQTGCYLDFLDATVRLNPVQRTFSIRIVLRDVVEYLYHRPFGGHYAFDQQRVYCAIALPRLVLQPLICTALHMTRSADVGSVVEVPRH